MVNGWFLLIWFIWIVCGSARVSALAVLASITHPTDNSGQRVVERFTYTPTDHPLGEFLTNDTATTADDAIALYAYDGRDLNIAVSVPFPNTNGDTPFPPNQTVTGTLIGSVEEDDSSMTVSLDEADDLLANINANLASSDVLILRIGGEDVSVLASEPVDGQPNQYSLSVQRGRLGTVTLAHTQGIEVTLYQRSQVTTLNYFADGELQTTDRPEASGNRNTAFTYDGDGRLLSQTDPGAGTARSTGFAYAITNTGEGDQTSGFPRTVFTAPDGLTTTSEFDRRGNLCHFTNKRDETFAFHYDGLGRQTSIATPLDLAAERALTTTYTHRGAPLTVTEPSGDVTTFNYHPTNGRLTSVTDDVGTISYTYDNNGNPLTVVEGSDTITRTYDRLGRVLSYTDENNQTIGYRYYDSGRLRLLIYPGGSESYGNVEYTYWQTGRLKNVIERLGATPRTSTFYWNNDGRLARIERPNGTKRVITYDAAGRPQLIQELRSNNAVIASFDISYYNSDEIYQLAISPSIDPAQFNASPSVALTFNADNQIATFEIPWLNGVLPGDGTEIVRHDADGNMTWGPNVNGVMTNYAYDARNRLTSFDDYSYTYDAEDERLSVTANGETTTFLNDPHNGLTRMLRRTKNGTTTRYVYGLGLLYEVDASGNAVYYHYDQSGSTIALTNQSQSVVEEVRYSPYGEILYRESNYDTPFLFTGFFGNYTDASGLIHMRARYYHPLIKRFINADPAQDGWNWYAYAAGNPLMFVDPSGLGNDSVLDALQTGLSVLGMVPVAGNVFDIANAGISAARGNWVDAGLNLASALPGIGLGVAGFTHGARLGARAVRAFEGPLSALGAARLPYRVPVTTSVSLQRTFATATSTYSGVRSTAIGRFLTSTPGLRRLNWQQHHVFIQQKAFKPGVSQIFLNNPAANRGLQRLGNAGFNLMPLPASLNRVLGRNPNLAAAFAGNLIGDTLQIPFGIGYQGYESTR